MLRAILTTSALLLASSSSKFGGGHGGGVLAVDISRRHQHQHHHDLSLALSQSSARTRVSHTHNQHQHRHYRSGSGETATLVQAHTKKRRNREATGHRRLSISNHASALSRHSQRRAPDSSSEQAESASASQPTSSTSSPDQAMGIDSGTTASTSETTEGSAELAEETSEQAESGADAGGSSTSVGEPQEGESVEEQPNENEVVETDETTEAPEVSGVSFSDTDTDSGSAEAEAAGQTTEPPEVLPVTDELSAAADADTDGAAEEAGSDGDSIQVAAKKIKSLKRKAAELENDESTTAKESDSGRHSGENGLQLHQFAQDLLKNLKDDLSELAQTGSNQSASVAHQAVEAARLKMDTELSKPPSVRVDLAPIVDNFSMSDVPPQLPVRRVASSVRSTETKVRSSLRGLSNLPTAKTLSDGTRQLAEAGEKGQQQSLAVVSKLNTATIKLRHAAELLRAMGSRPAVSEPPPPPNSPDMESGTEAQAATTTDTADTSDAEATGDITTPALLTGEVSTFASLEGDTTHPSAQGIDSASDTDEAE